MDPDRELNNDRVDDALRHLFVGAGHGAPSEGFDQRILNRLAVMPAPRPAVDKPLIPAMGWVMGGLIVLALIAGALAMPAGGSGYLEVLMQRAPRIDPGVIWSSPWVLMIALSATFLYALDNVLARRTLARNAQRRGSQ